MRIQSWLVAGVVVSVCALGGAPTALGAGVTPGWECIPTAAGQPIVSGGTGAGPSCGSGSTAVLAPTYVPSGIGGKATVQFAKVNVQIVNGGGTTSTDNGTGNLVLGYDESPGTQTGSHNLVLGEKQTYSGYADIIGGFGNSDTSSYGAVFGQTNKASAGYALLGGASNSVSASAGTATGGFGNKVATADSAISGGCGNLVGPGTAPDENVCFDTAGHNGDFASITGGKRNTATGMEASVSGGDTNLASGWTSVVAAGAENSATSTGTSVSGGDLNTARGLDASVAGGFSNLAAGSNSAVVAGEYNDVEDLNGAILGGCLNTSGASSNSHSQVTCTSPPSPTIRDNAITGGIVNVANGTAAVVSAGNSNSATGTSGAWVGGGFQNQSTGSASSLLGGQTRSISTTNGVQAGTTVFMP